MNEESRREFLLRAPKLFFGACLSARLPEQSQEQISIQFVGQELTPRFTEFLKNLVLNPPEVGGIANYNSPLDWGIGYTTLHNSTITTLRNFARFKDLETLTQAASGTDSQIESRCMADLSHLSILQALNGDKYSGLIATRCPDDVGQEFLAFAVSKPPEIEIKAIGPVLSTDCPDINHWQGTPSYLAFKRYKHMGWQHPPWNGLGWIADICGPLKKRLYPGLSGNPNNLDEGRAIILVKKQKALELLNHTTPTYQYR